jgi:RNA polymerase sigma-70 factor (ECF subfamily)
MGAGSGDIESRPIPAAEQPDGMMDAKERLHALQQALLDLTPEQREVFVLKHVEGLSYEEIATRIGGSVPSLKMRMHRAYDRLRQRLKDRM